MNQRNKHCCVCCVWNKLLSFLSTNKELFAANSTKVKSRTTSTRCSFIYDAGQKIPRTRRKNSTPGTRNAKSIRSRIGDKRNRPRRDDRHRGGWRPRPHEIQMSDPGRFFRAGDNLSGYYIGDPPSRPESQWAGNDAATPPPPPEDISSRVPAELDFLDDLWERRVASRRDAPSK